MHCLTVPMISRVLLLTAMLCLGCAPTPGPHPAVGRAVGPIELVSARDASRPPPGMTGKVTLLNFWATWCPPCRRELPGLARLADRLADERRFQLVAVACDEGDPATLAADIDRFLANQRIDLGAWIDPGGALQAMFTAQFGFASLPTSYLIGPDGRVLQVWVGYRSGDEADMARAILAALKVDAAGATPADR